MKQIIASPTQFNWYVGNESYESHTGPYSGPSEFKAYETYVQFKLMQLMGVPVVGVVGHMGADEKTWWVEWSCAGLRASAYYELTQKQLRALKKQRSL